MSSKMEDGRQSKAEHVEPMRVLDANELFAGAREIGILHAGAVYRLAVTRQGKLILTK